jgi:hypothetical protein
MGNIIFTGMPSGARLLFANRTWSNGVIDSVAPGRLAATADATGYQQWVQDIVVRPGATDTITVNMLPITAIANLGNTRANAPAVVLDSNQVRFGVNPRHGKIYIDDKEIGEGFKQVWVRLGTHRVRFDAPPCTPYVGTITVDKTPMPPLVKTLAGC